MPNKITSAPLLVAGVLEAVDSFVWLEPQTVSSFGRTETVSVHGSPPPLFLAHCAFLL
jgi:hypothetical protein